MNKLFKIKYLVLLTLTTLIVQACTVNKYDVNEGIVPVRLKATSDNGIITEGQTVTFTDLSLDVASRTWSFEGGSIETSNDQVVSVTYDEGLDQVLGQPNNSYPVTIEVEFQDGTLGQSNFNVTVFKEVTAEFSADKNAARFGDQVTFTNNSNGDSAFEGETGSDLDSYLWEFEGGVPATSTEKNPPPITYQDAGVFDVSLTVNRNVPNDSDFTTKEGFITIVSTDVISPTDVFMFNVGEQIILTYDAELDLALIDESKFTVTVDDTATELGAFELDPVDSGTLIINLVNPIIEGQTVGLNYAGSDLADSGELLSPVLDVAVPNKVINIFALGDFETASTDVYDVNNGFLSGGTAGPISADFPDGVGVDGSRALVYTATGAPGGNRRALFGDKDAANGNAQIITPISIDTEYTVKAMVKYTGTRPELFEFGMVNLPFRGATLIFAPMDTSTLVEGEFVEIRGNVTTVNDGSQEAISYAIPRITVGAGDSVITIDNIQVFER